MPATVTQEQFQKIKDETYILPDDEMTTEFRRFLSDTEIEVRVRNHPITNFDYIFYHSCPLKIEDSNYKV